MTPIDHAGARWLTKIRLPLAAAPIILSAILWGVLFVAVHPSRQEFPLHDDWLYARGLFDLARGEGINYRGLTVMPLLGQWLWALPFVRTFGDSLVTLRLSTILLSWIGMVALMDLLRQAGVPRGRAVLATACLAANPYFFLLSGTFMSDVPALSFSLVALALSGRAIRGERFAWMAGAALAATLATITRQNALVVPLVMAALLWQHPRLRARPVWNAAVLLPAALGGVTALWFASRPDTLRLVPAVPNWDRAAILLFAGIHTLALASAPLLLLAPAAASARRFYLALGLFLAVAFAYVLDAQAFPYIGNTIPCFVGMGDVPGSRPVLINEEVQTLITVLGCIAAALLIATSAGYIRSNWWRQPLLLFTMLHALVLLFSPFLYDRYLIPLLPGAFLAAAAGSGAERARPWPALITLAVLAFLSVALMHDWLAWSGAKWSLGRQALAQGIAACDIEGGYEWDGWHSEVPGRWNQRARPQGLMTPFMAGIFPHLTGKYALSFSPLTGTTVLETEPYRLWLLPGERRFHLLADSPPSRIR